jgi:hypothetical protein
MALKTNWIVLTPEQQAEIDHFTPLQGWRIMPQSELPSVFPADFRAKIDSAFVIAKETPTGGGYLVFNALRVDHKDKAIDQEPFGLIVHATGASSSGMFLHHGNWEGRTEPPPPEFWDQVSASGIGDYFYTYPPAGCREGTIDQLPKGHREAFEAVISRIRKSVDG